MDIFSKHGEQIINWENGNSSLQFLEETNKFQEYIFSLVKNGEIDEEEVIDFINNRTCSL